MRPYNEADTRAKLIDPRLKLAGWGESQIEREHYFVKGRAITNGRIYLVGDTSQRREPRRVNYLLRYHGQMIAVLEAKDETRSVDAGLEQAAVRRRRQTAIQAAITRSVSYFEAHVSPARTDVL